MKVSLVDAARVMGAAPVEPLAGQTGLATGASIDTRSLQPGDIFFAFEGEFLDGHDFVREAFLRGACAAVVEREVADAGEPQLVVADPLAALTELARYNRDVTDPIVVGITGSNGKTSTKHLLNAIASRKLSTVAAPGNFNTEYGLPLTLVRAGMSTEVVICEMGARGVGQIAQLCEVARPQVGVVTNVGVAHYEEFGSVDAVAATKGELIASLPPGGTAVLNADDPRVIAMGTGTDASVVAYGLQPTAEVTAEQVRLDASGRPTFRLIYRPSFPSGGSVWVTLKLIGRHQVYNALAAAGAALALGLSLDDCRVGLEAAVPVEFRMQVARAGDITIVNDAYNANPGSMAAALEACSEMAKGGRLVAVFGFMAELGAIAEEEHRRLGALAATKVGKLIAVGRASPIADAARAAGLDDVTVVADAAAALDALHPEPGDLVLIKGSRAAGLEGLASLIEERVRAA